MSWHERKSCKDMSQENTLLFSSSNKKFVVLWLNIIIKKPALLVGQ